MKTKEVQEQYNQYVLPTYTRVSMCIVKAKGLKVWDIEGKEYLDFFSGWAVSGLGHCHPAVVNAIKNQIRKVIHIPNNFYGIKQGQLAEKIIQHSFPGRVFFCNSGAEANEGAIKFARRYGSLSGRYEIVTMKNSFHGRTLGALAATAQEKYQKGFNPLLEGFKYVQLNDFEALQKVVSDKTVAIILEPIQGEGGVNIADVDYIKRLRTFCDDRKILLIFDEVQTGMGRTGYWFAFQHYGIEPDLMTLAKSLANGVPIGALVVNRRIKEEVLVAGTHASTFGGNPLATAAGLAVFKAIEEGGLLTRAKEMGEYLRAGLEKIKQKHPAVIKEIRGMGLMLGVELHVPGSDIVNRAREAGLLINCTQDKVLRIIPAMTITKRQADQGLDILDQVLASV
ncbi:MAG: acetylornithine aminotransferase [Omnitrophica bacterium RIFCSPLOWO2_12_FULL_44_17]|uniref:Acetylornithine aminotransferase n=1 Tax=Candidatus Danuiimicrobium aquiferis TaxID=1801832 RepID=A0A1G1L1K0_9BACT|nr:MAG: acetylornithine aminotransferase [Omnitrophica bacterium RIFCSPHIGHO2_02_FULL_45_28]OGW90420.1 MAG: acetylornithine aminotransferase [Omnitrophica bacterium RIFCSPHIGHO2_12_FULL_44_12]OGW99033.1 MAG: acetylornithine aminotransferase [Omnitrophica bacterium RIFCSPLOWO2_12_FULL_44_17]OGX02574.1 MAG: acetylornithine aminotransferase [Omnitrophica bacterium RIFCSPLOWO2_02_FULL_44_11]